MREESWRRGKGVRRVRERYELLIGEGRGRVRRGERKGKRLKEGVGVAVGVGTRKARKRERLKSQGRRKEMVQGGKAEAKWRGGGERWDRVVGKGARAVGGRSAEDY